MPFSMSLGTTCSTDLSKWNWNPAIWGVLGTLQEKEAYILISAMCLKVLWIPWNSEKYPLLMEVSLLKLGSENT